MKNTFLLLGALFFATTASVANTVEGQIFISTKGGDNVKLGSVLVRIYDLAEYTKSISAATRERGENEKFDREWKKLQREFDNLASANRTGDAGVDDLEQMRIRIRKQEELLEKSSGYIPKFLAKLNITPIVEGETDADGKYSIQFETTKDYVLIATGSRSVGSGEEWYYWVIKNPKGKLNLNNRNKFVFDWSGQVK
jgi:hypothetical protein